MKFDPEIHHRRSVRLGEYDYSTPGAYFVTICAHSRRCLFGEVVDEEAHLNDAGRMVQQAWDGLPGRFPHLQLDEFVAMPNHIHGIIVLTENRRGESCVRPNAKNHKEGDHKDRPYGTLTGSLGRIIQTFKSITTNKYITGVQNSGWSPYYKRLWQRNYYEHVIRNERELDNVRQYIIENPVKWALDPENPAAKTTKTEEPWQV